MLPSYILKREIFKLYNKDPIGWYILIRRDQKGYYDTTIVHKKDVWLIKEEQINPYELIGFGFKGELENNEALKFIRSYQFGFRPISKKILDDFMISLNDEKNLSKLMSKIIEEDPVPVDKIKSEFMVQGPLIYPTKPIELISNQNEMDVQLKIELDKLIYRKYPHLLTTYL
ncbi:MAG: hypothetical protein QXL52_05535 [Nitrososphaerales archaeon]